MAGGNNNIIPFPGTSANAAAAGSSSSGSGTPSTGGGSGGGGGGSPVSDPYEWSRARVWSIRYLKKYNEDQKRRILVNFIITNETRKTPHGAFLKTSDKRAYLFDGGLGACKLYKIDEKDAEFRGYMQLAYGLNSSEQLTRHVMSALQNATIATGLLRDVRRFSYWDRYRQTLYISRYDGTCYEIDGDEIKVRNNGYGSAVFLDDDGGFNCDAPPDDGPIVGNHHELMKQLIDDLNYVPTTSGSMSPATQRTCLGIWLFAVAFPDLMPTKPIMLVEGMPGSGKTFALQRIAMTLHGKSAPLTIAKKEDPDFGVKILRSPLAIIDDVNTTIEWLQDTLCSYATGGTWSKRKLFTDDTEHVIRPHSFLQITSNNPTTFRQGQLADRCLIIRLERRTDNFGSADQLLERAQSWRPQLQGEWLYWLNEIVRELRRPQPMMTSPYRMADFARVAHVIGRVLNQEAGPPGDWSPEAIDEMLAAMQAERDALVIGEGDQLIELLDKWLDVVSNQGREVRVADLHRELAMLAKMAGNQTFFKSPKGLAARLREAGGALGRHFEVTRQTGAGDVMMYTFRRT